jgi:hypothetical protein
MTATGGVTDRPEESNTVRVSTGWNMPAADPAAGDVAGGAEPRLWLGAPAPGGLTLPNADPTPGTVYAPRGVWIDDERIIVTDTGNHRVLIWHRPGWIEQPDVDHTDADVVLGQASPFDEGPQAGGRGPENGLHLPTGVLVHEGRLVVADAWNHRLLIWNDVPTVSDRPADLVIGQPDRTSVDENQGGDCRADSFYWPFGLAMVDGQLWVTDTGNRRLVAFDGLPEPGQAPIVILGQPTATTRDENRGRLGADSFRWPHDIATDGEAFFVADAGNHRLLAWDQTPVGDRPADRLYGQPDYETAIELPYAPQSAATMRFPYALAIDPSSSVERRMAMADTANNRVLVWDRVPTESGQPADRVLGQYDFATIGENRWDLVGPDTFCWPYGLCLHRGQLAVADSGNNRVTVWDLR